MLLACLLLVATVTLAQPAGGGFVTLDHAEAVRSGWNAPAPPATGWVPVKLMDSWNRRWPHHSGVVWYRLHWHQANTDAPAGLLIEYTYDAYALWVNGSLIHRDPHLTEPLTRSWVSPHYFLIDKPILHAGENTLLVRVSGLALYRPGLGKVDVGDNAAVYALYRRQKDYRYNIHLFNFAVSAVLGVLFLVLWLVRRKETMFGWYALYALLSAGYAVNFVASSPWPFPTTGGWEATNTSLFVASQAALALFLLDFAGYARRRLTVALLIVIAVAFAVEWGLPRALIGGVRIDVGLAAIALYYVAVLAFIAYAVRTPRIDARVLAACLVVPLLASLHDVAVFTQWIHSSRYDLGALTSPISLIGVSFVVAWRFAQAMHVAEGFNLQLRKEVATATADLSATLAREHELALTNARMQERLNLVRDLHDGFGGSLMGAIAELRQIPEATATRVLGRLMELRDDLRLVIETTTHDADTDLAGMLASLRHRWSPRFERAGIDVCWQLVGLDGMHAGASFSLDLLRFLQEALTNILKHSGACTAEITVQRTDVGLHVQVRDDGRGFDPTQRMQGAGLASLHSRAQRLGGHLAVRAAPGQGADFALDLLLP